MTTLTRNLPLPKVFIQSILPVNSKFGKFGDHTGNSQKINRVNAALKQSANSHAYTYVDIFSPFSNSEGLLQEELTNDGLHLTG
jgi:hypothetical protein